MTNAEIDFLIPEFGYRKPFLEKYYSFLESLKDSSLNDVVNLGDDIDGISATVSHSTVDLPEPANKKLPETNVSVALDPFEGKISYSSEIPFIDSTYHTFSAKTFFGY